MMPAVSDSIALIALLTATFVFYCAGLVCKSFVERNRLAREGVGKND